MTGLIAVGRRDVDSIFDQNPSRDFIFQVSMRGGGGGGGGGGGWVTMLIKCENKSSRYRNTFEIQQKINCLLLNK